MSFRSEVNVTLADRTQAPLRLLPWLTDSLTELDWNLLISGSLRRLPVTKTPLYR